MELDEVTPSMTGFAKSFTVQNLPESEVELVGEIPFQEIEPLQARALKHFAEDIELPGFRKGRVPLDMVKKRVGDIAILQEAVEYYMRDFYPALVTTLEIDAVGRPEIRITKLASGNPVGLSIKTAVYPEIKLPRDWKTLYQTIPDDDVPSVEEKEVDDALESIRNAQAKATTTAEVPIDDAFAQSLGGFTDLADLKTKLSENILQDKTLRMRDKRRGKILDKLLEKTPLSVPAIFVDSELEKIIGQMHDDAARYGLSFEEYLKRIGKTEEEVRNEVRDQARKRATLQLVLNKIATEEKIGADKEAVENEMKHALEHFPEARPDLLRIHIETLQKNEKVLKMLEGSEIPQGKPTPEV